MVTNLLSSHSNVYQGDMTNSLQPTVCVPVTTAAYTIKLSTNSALAGPRMTSCPSFMYSVDRVVWLDLSCARLLHQGHSFRPEMSKEDISVNHVITVTSYYGDGVSNPRRLDPFLNRLAQIKENIKALRHWPLWGESTGDRWIPLKKASNAENVSIWLRYDVSANHSALRNDFVAQCWFPGTTRKHPTWPFQQQTNLTGRIHSMEQDESLVDYNAKVYNRLYYGNTAVFAWQNFKQLVIWLRKKG